MRILQSIYFPTPASYFWHAYLTCAPVEEHLAYIPAFRTPEGLAIAFTTCVMKFGIQLLPAYP